MPGHDFTAEQRLILEVTAGNARGVEEIIAAGTSVAGSSELSRALLMVAVMGDRVSMAKLLIEKGADIETRAPGDPRLPLDIPCSGMQVVHFAAAAGKLDFVLMLLEAGANPNSADEIGNTPLMHACANKSKQRVKLVRELLKRGAHPTQSSKNGLVALHFAAGHCEGDVDMIDTLLSHAPATLNHATWDGETPLSTAAVKGEEGAVSHLLSAGASNREALAIAKEKDIIRSYQCPLALAVAEGHENVVSILLDDGLEAIGGLFVIPQALACATYGSWPRIVQRLLTVEGEERRGYWARCCFEGVPVLHHAVAGGNPAQVGILLAAGADEITPHSDGRRARDVVGLGLPEDDRSAMKEAAMLRTLERGPAFRAQSWTWPSRRDTSAPAPIAALAIPLSNRAPRALLDIRGIRLNRESLVKLIGRYTLKL